MALYQLNQGKINGIYYNQVPLILTTTGNTITIRVAGEPTPFIESPLSEFVDESGQPFATVAAFVTYWNTHFTQRA